MEIGLALPQYDYEGPGTASWPSVVECARSAERLGFGSVWLADHLFLSIEKYGGPPGRHFGFEPITALAGVARATSTIGLGTLVVCSQLRPAAVLAKSAASLDRISGGRVTLGLGAGWFEPEYEEAGVPFERPGVRLAQLAETIQVVKGMTRSDEPFSFNGRHITVEGARARPGPARPDGPPVWVGGRGDKLLDVVARHADGWNIVWALTSEAYRERVGVLEAACERAGRDPATVHRSVGLYTLVGENERDLGRRFEALAAGTMPGVLSGLTLDEWRQGRLVGTVEQVREQAADWASLGVSTLILGLGALPFASTSGDDIELAAAALIEET